MAPGPAGAPGWRPQGEWLLISLLRTDKLRNLSCCAQRVGGGAQQPVVPNRILHGSLSSYPTPPSVPALHWHYSNTASFGKALVNYRIFSSGPAGRLPSHPLHLNQAILGATEACFSSRRLKLGLTQQHPCQKSASLVPLYAGGKFWNSGPERVFLPPLQLQWMAGVSSQATAAHWDHSANRLCCCLWLPRGCGTPST